MSTANVGNGECRTSTGTCTLRAAIQEANAFPGPDTITVPAGTYAITIAPLGEFIVDPNDGDFDITDAVTITGAGSLNTIIDAGTPPSGLAPEVHGLDRLFDIHPTAKTTTITGLTVRDGYTPEDGGAIRFGEFDPAFLPPNPGTLRLVDVSVLDNYAGKHGGGIRSSAAAASRSSTRRSPATARPRAARRSTTGAPAPSSSRTASSPRTPALSSTTPPTRAASSSPTRPTSRSPTAAINNQAETDTIGTIVVRRTTFTGNAANSDGPAIHNSGDGVIGIYDSDFTDNVTEATGGAVYSAGGTLTIEDSEFAGNRAHDGGAIYFDGDVTDAGTRSRVRDHRQRVPRQPRRGVRRGDRQRRRRRADHRRLRLHRELRPRRGRRDHRRRPLEHRHLRQPLRRQPVVGQRRGGLASRASGPDRSPTRCSARTSPASASVDELGFPVEGDGTGGGLHTGASGPFTIEDSTFERNEAHGDGGALGIHSSGTVRVTDTVIRDNHARGEEAGGGGVENSGERVTFTRVLVTGNTATGNGGGIHNTSSNEFTVVDTTITDNKAENGGGFANASDSTLTIRGSLIANNLARFGPRDTHGHGGGLYSIGDAGGIVENTTISGNTARVRGGGVYNDADGELRMANVTIWRNSAPFGGGVGVMESDAVPTVPPTPLTGLIIRNSIVAGSIQGGGCDGAVKSEGGNLDMGSVVLHVRAAVERHHPDRRPHERRPACSTPSPTTAGRR